jgi:glycosyltransferase involved in cell wall biosynthesis
VEAQLVQFSVVICTRNRAVSLRRTLASIEQAARPNVEWELVIVDNGSTDETADVVTSFEDRLPIRRVFEPTPGLSIARNTGGAESKGDYILWTDDDVSVRATWLQAFSNAFSANPDTVIFGGRVLPQYEEPKIEWFVQAEDKLRSLLACRDFSGPVSLDRMPFGACYAVRAAEQKSFPYDPNLGVAPGRRTGGEETAVLEAILRTGAKGVWVHDGVVDHIIPLERQSISYIMRYYRSQGRLYPEQNLSGRMVAGAPMWLWRDTARNYLRYRSNRALGREWVSHLVNFARRLGNLDTSRSAPRLDE